jgi:hypothetical protein
MLSVSFSLCYAECLKVCAIMLSVIMLSVIMLNVVMLSVVAPTHSLTRRVRLMFQIVRLAWACLLFQIVNQGTLT